MWVREVCFDFDLVSSSVIKCHRRCWPWLLKWVKFRQIFWNWFRKFRNHPRELEPTFKLSVVFTLSHFCIFFPNFQFHFRIFYDKINDLEGNRGQSGDHKCWLERVIPSLITCCDTKASLELQPGECEPGPVNSRKTNSKQTNSNYSLKIRPVGKYNIQK